MNPESGKKDCEAKPTGYQQIVWCLFWPEEGAARFNSLSHYRSSSFDNYLHTLV